MPRQSNNSQSSKMRKKRAAARAAAPPKISPEPATPSPAPYNPAPAPMPSFTDPPRSSLTDWDATALSLLRKLGKRDATTRLRALTDLRTALPDAPDDAGAPFLSRLANLFPALLLDGHPRARAGALHLAGDAARVFRKRAKDVLPLLAPHWISALADSATTVTIAARTSLADAFPQPRQQAAFAAFTARALRDHCYELLAQPVDGASAARICAIIEWAASASSGTLGALAEFVDDPMQPLCQIADTAPDPVCRAALPLIDVTQPGRATMFAGVALRALRDTPAAWDVLLLLFVRGCGQIALGKELAGLADALTDALQAPSPPPVAALLPLLAGLPSLDVAAQIADKVLRTLRAMLGVGADARELVPTSYALSVLPAYLENATFVATANKWSHGTAEQTRSRVLEEYVAPVAHALLVGALLPCPKSSRPTPQRPVAGASKRPGRDDAVLAALVKALSVYNTKDFGASLPATAAAFTAALAAGTQDASRLAVRYASILRGKSDSEWARCLASAVVGEIVSASAVEEVASTLLQVLSDSVSTIPTLADDGPSERREQCAEFAILHAACDPAAAGVVLAWATEAIASSANVVDADQAASRLADKCTDQIVLFSALAAMVEAHSAKHSENAAWWKPFEGSSFEAITTEAAKKVQAEEEEAEAALKLLAAVVRYDGGVKLGDVSYKEALVAVADSMRKDAVVRHSVVEAALGGASEPPHHLLEFAGAVVAHRGVSKAVSDFLGKLPKPCWHAFAVSVLDEFEGMDGDEDFVQLAVLWRDAVDAVAGGKDATELYAVLFDRFEAGTLPLLLLESVIDQVPLGKLFGGTENSPLLVGQFFKVYSIYKVKQDNSACAQLEEHVRSLPTALRSNVAEEAVKRILESVKPTLLPIVSATLKNEEGKEQELVVESAIAALVAQSVTVQKKSGLAPNVCNLLVQVIEMTATASKRRAIPCFKETLEQASGAIRRDPNSKLAQFGAMVLGAALVPDEGDFLEGHPDWLVELVTVSLKAIRRAQESRTLGPAATQKKRLSESPAIGTGALLMTRAIDALDVPAIHSDDWRFWSMTVEDTLLDAQSADARHRVSQCVVANIAALAVRLIQAHETSVTRLALRLGGDDALPIRVKCEEIIHRSSWSAVMFLPTLAASPATEDRAQVLSAHPDALAKLALMAVERKLFIPADGALPIPAENIFALIPLLSSRNPEVRRAALVLIVHSGRVELPAAVAREFPPSGITDEAHEERFVRKMVPVAFQIGLVWKGDGADVRSSATDMDEDALVSSLAYFLTWRAFLELLFANNKTAVNEEGEDVSFRRIGISFLRTNDTLFETFFARCAAVVVYGTPEEKEAAAGAAVKVLANSGVESKLQGIQIARAQASYHKEGGKKKEETDKKESDAHDTDALDSLQREVCVSTGAAFARALQRLPALSRRLGTERLGLSDARSVEQFAEERVSRLLIALEIDRMRSWSAFGAGLESGEGALSVRGSVAGREVGAVYSFSDIKLEIVLRLPAAFPLHVVDVEATSAKGMGEARWRRTVLGMKTVLELRDGSLVEAVELWRRNLDKTFEGVEECPICYSVLHLTSAVLPKTKCRTCKHMFHTECLTKWFQKSDNPACPLCRSVFY